MVDEVPLILGMARIFCGGGSPSDRALASYSRRIHCMLEYLVENITQDMVTAGKRYLDESYDSVDVDDVIEMFTVMINRARQK